MQPNKCPVVCFALFLQPIALCHVVGCHYDTIYLDLGTHFLSSHTIIFQARAKDLHHLASFLTHRVALIFKKSSLILERKAICCSITKIISPHLSPIFNIRGNGFFQSSGLTKRVYLDFFLLLSHSLVSHLYLHCEPNVKQ